MRTMVIVLFYALASGCLGDPGVPSTSDAGYLSAPDFAIACSANNDGVIERSEFPFLLGASARYLQNPDGTNATVDPVGQQGPDGPAWDFTSTEGVAVDLPIQSLSGAWYAGSFPDATYATYTDLATKTLGVFRLSDNALEVLGYASETPNQTLLIYDKPVALVQFPVQLGNAYVTVGHIVNGMFNGLPVAETDTYSISVDAKGVVVLPYLRVANTLRIRVVLDQALPGGINTHTIQLLYMRECVGEVGRMVSKANETDPNFTSAAIFRRLAL
jgi:hypothetical protein